MLWVVVKSVGSFFVAGFGCWAYNRFHQPPSSWLRPLGGFEVWLFRYCLVSSFEVVGIVFCDCSSELV